MGAIQGSINQMLGTTAAAAFAVKKAKENFEAEGESLLKEQSSLAGQAEINDAKVEEVTQAVSDLEHKSQDKRLGQTKKEKLAHDLDVARSSLSDLTTQQDAIRKLRGINTANIEAYRKKGGNI